MKPNKKQTVDNLKAFIFPKTIVYAKVESVARSGMSRAISVYAVKNGEIADITYSTAVLCDFKMHKNKGLVVQGCGMDMGWHVVYRLGCALWPDGTPEPHGTRNGEPDNTGGYALMHRWL